MNERGSRAGMTLLEVLIAVTLFGILSVGILLILRVGLNAMERSDDRLMQNRREAYAARIVQAQLTGFMPEMAMFKLTPQSPTIAMPFFQGEAATMRFVSSYSLQDAGRGKPQILEFQVIAGANGRGVRLVVNERPFTGVTSTGALCLGYAPTDPATGVRVPLFRPVQTGTGSFVLADNLAYCRFLFQSPRVPPLPPVWVDHWVRTEWPPAVRIEMAPLEPNRGRLQPMNVTTAMHINREVQRQYADN